MRSATIWIAIYSINFDSENRDICAHGNFFVCVFDLNLKNLIYLKLRGYIWKVFRNAIVGEFSNMRNSKNLKSQYFANRGNRRIAARACSAHRKGAGSLAQGLCTEFPPPCG